MGRFKTMNVQMTTSVPSVPLVLSVLLRCLRSRRHPAFVFLLAFVLAAPAFAAPKTQIRLLLSAETARPGDVIWAGLQMKTPAGWHTYWQNGGDAGQPTEIKWTLPPDITADGIRWPLPHKEIDAAGDTSLVTYVYTNEVILLAPLTLGQSLKPGPLTISASAKWMECSDICVLGDGVTGATLVIGAELKSSPDAAALENWRKRLPQPDNAASASASWETPDPKAHSRGLMIEWKTQAVAADFFPYASTNFDLDGTTETMPSAPGTIRLRKMVKTNDAGWPRQIDGVLAGVAGPGGPMGLEEHFTIQAASAAVPGGAPIPAASLLPMLFLAFLGGLILNIMPCVLPVIALKVLGFVNQTKEEPRRIRQLGAVYGLGVLTSFLVLAGLAIGAQRAGGLANWGDAFRHPQFQIALTILMTLIALNLFGVFEVTLGGKAMGAAGELSARRGFSGAFFNGILATVLATPCTAPFLGAALAFAFTQTPGVTILVFLAAGFGLAFPFVAICWNPRLLKLLPKPGAWMEQLKKAMGFPMLAAAVWLLWVSSNKEDDSLWLGLFLVVIAFAAWVWGEFVQRGARRKGVALAVCLLLIGADYVVILEKQLRWRASPQDKAAGIDWQVWRPEAVDAARRAGHPVLVDFTAKSCLTCKLNQASSLEIDRTRAKLKEIGAVAFKADYTLEDPVIGRELRRFNTPGVPLVLVYSKNPGQQPQVLPVFLTPDLVNDALDKAK